jgi:TPR repeat protein
MRIAPAWLVAAFALQAAICAGYENAPRSEADAAKRVLKHRSWMKDAHRCPADLMPDAMRKLVIPDIRCSGEALSACYQRCESGQVHSCYWLAYAVQQSKVDDRAAEVLFTRACRLGEPSGCVNRAAGLMKEKPRDAATLRCAARTFERTCDLADIWGCSMSGLTYWKGLGVPVDHARAKQAFAKACARPADRGHEACKTATSMLEEMKLEVPDIPARP